MASLLIHLWLSNLISLALGQFASSCAWDDFTLAGAQGYEIQCIDDQFAYGYTPCMSYALCSGQRYQSVYFSRTTGQCQYFLAQWDEGDTEPIFRRRDGIFTWTFEYSNGQSCNGGERRFDVTWECDELAQPFSLQTTCGKSNDECHHTMNIRSVYACIEGVEETSGLLQRAGLSTGSVVLILLSLIAIQHGLFFFFNILSIFQNMIKVIDYNLQRLKNSLCTMTSRITDNYCNLELLICYRSLVVFILYCGIGYGINVKRSDEQNWKEFKDHTPHWSFWTYGLCAYTKAGCTVSYEWITAKVGSNEGVEGTDHLLDNDVEE